MRSKGQVEHSGSGEIYYITDPTDPAMREEVNLAPRRNHPHKVQCCTYVKEYALPCEHCALVFHERKFFYTGYRRTKAVIGKFWPKWVQYDTWAAAYENMFVKRPAVVRGPYNGPAEDVVFPPPAPTKKRGRPRKSRFKRHRSVRARVSRLSGHITRPDMNEGFMRDRE
jgi:hypothetical protein